MEVIGNNSHNTSISLKMKSLIEEINKFLKSRTEDSALLINKYLQAFSVTIDTSFFEPDTNIGARFFVSLYELFTNIEPQTQMAWNCVDLLSNACRNSSARRALISTYHFIPSLSRLLSDQQSAVKKKKLLKLMQDLSCGIKISWQIPHLPHLLSTLTKWVEQNEDEDIVCLSLGVLVNLCYKNLPAIYTLSRSIDIKKFLRYCLPLSGPIIELHVWKLMIILDNMKIEIPEHTLIKLVEPTFLSIYEALQNNDPMLLRQIVDFFLDIVTQNKDRAALDNYKMYGDHLRTLIGILENNTTNSMMDSEPKCDPECISIVLEFIHSLMVHKLLSRADISSKLVQLTISWVNSDKVSFQALTLLATMVNQVVSIEGSSESAILNLLLASLPVFLLILQSDPAPTNMDNCQKLSAVLHLLMKMLQAGDICNEILGAVKHDMLMNIFSSMQSENLNDTCLPIFRSDDCNISTTDTVNMYLYALGLVNELAKHDTGWLALQSTLVDNRRIHMFISQALFGGSPEAKLLALQICRNNTLPLEKVVTAMNILQPIFSNESAPKQNQNQHISEEVLLSPSFAQMEKLDNILANLKEMIEENEISNIATSQVMELYEYKLASLGYEERAALNNLAAASERCTKLQHRLAQITAEQNKLQQLLFHTQYCLEQTNKSREEYKENYVQEQNRALAANGRIKVCEGQLRSNEKVIKELQEQLGDHRKQLNEMMQQNKKLKEQLAKKEEFFNRLVENGKKVEINLQKTDDQLKKSNIANKNLNLKISQLEEDLNKKCSELGELTKQYHATRSILETITKVANSQFP